MCRVRSCVGERSALPIGGVRLALRLCSKPLGFSSESGGTDRHFSATAACSRNPGSPCLRQAGNELKYGTANSSAMPSRGTAYGEPASSTGSGARDCTSKHHAARYHAAYVHV
jgi:hypothetical protein